MKRLPLLLIAIFMLILSGAIVFFGISFAMAPVQQQQEYAVKTFSFLPLAIFGTMFLGFVIWIWALIHMLTNQSIQGMDKIVWALVIIFLNVLGAIIYFILSPLVRLQPPNPPTASK